MKEQKKGMYGAVQSVQFSPIIEQPAAVSEKKQLQLLTDVSLQLSFELGRTKKTVREILQLKKGSVLSLNKLAGESIDVLVNNMTIASGELVVLDEQFSIRITDILSKQERERKIK
ncbi:flagellar motor switch protein FliN [Neobacillus sp. 114]|uniref:flagellar motor switch protein FliN n=1 Tax=Neobacillus sp. 114 TaxID=3048535 RepID=UPI0024C46B29|nr:flagellar motor switch protein FliN [Neobacillus sp. 114]